MNFPHLISNSVSKIQYAPSCLPCRGRVWKVNSERFGTLGCGQDYVVRNETKSKKLAHLISYGTRSKRNQRHLSKKMSQHSHIILQTTPSGLGVKKRQCLRSDITNDDVMRMQTTQLWCAKPHRGEWKRLFPTFFLFYEQPTHKKEGKLANNWSTVVWLASAPPVTYPSPPLSSPPLTGACRGTT